MFPLEQSCGRIRVVNQSRGCYLPSANVSGPGERWIEGLIGKASVIAKMELRARASFSRLHCRSANKEQRCQGLNSQDTHRGRA